MEFSEIPKEVQFVGTFGEGTLKSLKTIETSTPCKQTGFVEAALNNQLKGLYCGHDHHNDFIGHYSKEGGQTIELGYGRKSGYGGYGPIEGVSRGGRVIIMKNLGEVNFISYQLG